MSEPTPEELAAARLAVEKANATRMLCAWGCSFAYAYEITDRVLEPNAVLNAGDAEWLRMIRAEQRRQLNASEPRWANAN